MREITRGGIQFHGFAPFLAARQFLFNPIEWPPSLLLKEVELYEYDRCTGEPAESPDRAQAILAT